MPVTTLVEMESHVQNIVGPSLHALEATHKLGDVGAMSRTTDGGKAEYVVSTKRLTDHVAASCTICRDFNG